MINLLLISLLVLNGTVSPMLDGTAGSPPKGASVWPGFRGTGDSHTEAEGLPLTWSETKNIAWNIPLPGYGQSSPVVWKGRLFLTAVEGAMKEKLIVLSYDLKSGREIWRKEFVATFTMKDAGTVSKAAPTPVVDDKRVYFFFESGDLLAFDHSGKLQWQRKLADEYGGYKTNHGLGSSLAITDDAVVTLVVHSGPSYLLAADKRTGKNLWKQELKPGGGWSTPLVIGQTGKQQILLSIGGSVTAYDGKTGEPIWSFGGLKGNNIPSPSVDPEQGLLVAGSSDKGMNVAIRLGGSGDVTASNLLWRAPEAAANFCSPLIHQGYVYFVNKVGVAFCLDLKTGEERWRQRLGGEVWASPLAAGNRIYVFGVDGKTFVLQAGAKFQQLAMNELTDVERVYGVAAVDRALLIRSGRKLTKLAER
jgi:outer membrane protein assembly factor BamB